MRDITVKISLKSINANKTKFSNKTNFCGLQQVIAYFLQNESKYLLQIERYLLLSYI